MYRSVWLSWRCSCYLRYTGNSNLLDHPTDGVNPEHLGSCTSEVSEESVGVRKEHSASL